MVHTHTRCAWRLAVLLILVFNFRLFAQVDTGAIRGTITDISGKVLLGAKVTITQEETGLTQTTQTGPEGTYLFTPVRIGTYTVTAGFTWQPEIGPIA